MSVPKPDSKQPNNPAFGQNAPRALSSEIIISAQDSHAKRPSAGSKTNGLLFDDLTQLPNRQFLLELLQRATATNSRTRHRSALLVIALNNVGEISTRYGQSQADALVLRVAQRLRKYIRDTDTAARVDDNQFGVLLEELSADCAVAVDQADTASRRILESLYADAKLLGSLYRTTTLTSGSLVFAGEIANPEDLMACASGVLTPARADER